MRVLIVENEIYLAQNISAKLSDIGFECHIATTKNEALEESLSYDVVLLSTNISGQNFYPIIEKYRDLVIILMISYVSNDTVANPLKSGANDYILKPFMIDELIRKINHYREFENIKRENSVLSRYVDFVLDGSFDACNINMSLPLFIKTNHQRLADYCAFNIAKERNILLDFIHLNKDWQKKIQNIKKDRLTYIVGFEELKKAEKKDFLSRIDSNLFIISTTDLSDELEDIESVELKSSKSGLEGGDILSVDEYIKLMVKTHQDKYPDTELSKRLGMSRKSLWEKRKKYGIEKKK